MFEIGEEAVQLFDRWSDMSFYLFIPFWNGTCQVYRERSGIELLTV